MVYSLNPEDLERIRRSIVCLAPRQPAGLDREAAVALLGELQRLQGKDRRVQQLLDQVVSLLAAARADDEADADG
jgi:hypothetical protein